ncbi:MAG: potassium channel family protein [Burkholderiales bacterium]|nr:potassium channel family protein [Burkholderiales bacterium]
MVAVTAAAVVACVLIHYEGLVLASRTLARMGGHRRVKVLYAIGWLLGLHVVEIWIFGVALWALAHWPEAGSVGGGIPHLFDAVYFSAVTFTTVGYGDLTPVGPIRFVSGTEALAGFVLIAWSASFTYLEMERFWRSP